jgi:WD40 repeat protein
VAFSPDGATLASGGEDGVLRLWETVTWEQTKQITIAQHTGHIWHIAYSPDGTTIATADSRGTLSLWDVATGHLTGAQPSEDIHAQAIVWSPDGATIATAGADRVLRLWNPATWEQINQITIVSQVGLVKYSAPVRDIAYSPDSTIIATACADETIRLWNPSTNQLAEHGGAAWAVAYSPDSTAIATADAGEVIHLRDPATWEETSQITIVPRTGELPYLAYIRDIAYNPDSTIIAAACADGTIRLWNLATSHQTNQLIRHTGSANAIDWSPDGNTLATGGTDTAIRLWAASTGEQTAQLTGHHGAINALAYSPDGAALAAGDADFTCRLWDLATGQQTARIPRGVGGPVSVIDWSPDGNTIAAGYGDGAICLCDPSTGERVAEFTRHHHSIAAVAFSPDGRILASGAGSVRLWDTITGRQIARLTAHHNFVLAVAWSPDGTLLATSAGSVRVWDTSTWQPREKLRGHGGAVRAIAWNPDGSTLAAVGRFGTIQLWDTATWQSRAQLAGHTEIVRGLAWNPRGTILASVGDDGTIRIWNPRNGVQINGTGFGAARAPARALAGVQSDSPSGEDLLGIGDDVDTLAELIAATETKPPLAIALIGDWGTGKSSVMLQVERQITVLADRARNNPGRSAFTENVRQVRFNAWHYSDDQLWTGLVSHLLEVLAVPAEGGENESASGRRKIIAERDRLRTRLDEKQNARDKLAGQLESADDVPQPQGLLGWLGSPAYTGKILLTAAGQTLRDGRVGLLAILAWAVIGAGAYVSWHFLRTPIGHAVTAIAVLAPPVVAVARKLKSGHDAVLRFGDRERSSLTARQRDFEREIKDLQDRLVLIDAAARLARFFDDRGEADAYRRYQGLLGQVHADLKELSADLAAARTQWAAGGGIGTPPLQRIVLYIDDLDRCPPRRVVDVLEAVHLMLSLDLFVVVVAVDARWLIRSLEYHHHEHFRESDQDEETVATPVDYLDKIFQIPFALRRPDPGATAKYLRSLLPEPLQAAPSTTHTAPSGQDVNADSDRDPASSAGASQVITSQNSAPLAGATPDEPDPAERQADPAEDSDEPLLSPLSRELRDRLHPPARNEPIPAPVIELRPQGLQLSQPEIEFMTRLGGLVPTPRAAKRLVNIYRLVRIGIPNAELSDFTGDVDAGPYRAVQVLLAILVGHPKAARTIFGELLAGETDDDLAAVVEKTDEADSSFPVIKHELARLQSAQSLTVSAFECRRWCPLLARFSFYTRDLARTDSLARPLVFENRPGLPALFAGDGRQYACTRCARLPDMKPRPDSPHRGNAVGREVIGERLRGLPLERSGIRHRGHNHRLRPCLSTADDHHEQLIGPDQRHGRPRGHRSTHQTMAQAVRHAGRQRRCDTQAEQPPRQPRNRRLPARRVQHHHRTGIDQPVHCERHQAGCPAHLTVRPHQVIGMLIRRHRGHRGDAHHGPGGRPPDDPVRRHHRAPPSSANSVVNRGTACWLFGDDGPRTLSHISDLRLFVSKLGLRRKAAGHRPTDSSPPSDTNPLRTP